ncbi:hypothetical protein AAJP47_02780 [Psychrobacter sp. B38]|uniref:hypothetical protein n=1 Tax=Psychrobacter sp. B38 TaxID=3143538 RepID=UPI00320FAD15
MNQTFTLCIATETIANDARQLGVTIDELHHIRVHVSADIVQQPTLHLQLTYHVTLPSETLAAQLDWPAWQAAQVGFSDYLWEKSCLECFIAGDLIEDDLIKGDLIKGDSTTNGLIKDERNRAGQTDAYIEINASPDGRYALYKFDRYRQPATLPPTPLYQADGHTLASIDWISLYNQSSTTSRRLHYERRFGVRLTELPNQQYALNNTTIEYIHPCVILKLDNTTLFFAPEHASPPDFHNRHHWTKFKA